MGREIRARWYAMSISELDQLLAQRFGDRIRRGGALALENRERFLLFKTARITSPLQREG